MNIGVGPYSGGGIRQNPDADPPFDVRKTAYRMANNASYPAFAGGQPTDPIGFCTFLYSL